LPKSNIRCRRNIFSHGVVGNLMASILDLRQCLTASPGMWTPR
jgi:hypothetical protein